MVSTKALLLGSKKRNKTKLRRNRGIPNPFGLWSRPIINNESMWSQCYLFISVVLPTPQSPTSTSLDILVEITDLTTAEAEMVALLHSANESDGEGKSGCGKSLIVLLSGVDKYVGILVVSLVPWYVADSWCNPPVFCDGRNLTSTW